MILFRILLSCLALLCLMASVRADYTFTTLDVPGSIPGTSAAFGISADASKIVGMYLRTSDSTTVGFVYDGSSYTTISNPGGFNTYANGISGNNIVGYYQSTSLGGLDTGYIYNGTTYTNVAPPDASGGGGAQGIDGSNIVGSYGAGNGSSYGYLYDGIAYTQLDDPASHDSLGNGSTAAYGVYGNTVVGYYNDLNTSTQHGFVYNISTATFDTLDDPLGISGTQILGIYGNNYVGAYYDADGYQHGFVYDSLTDQFTTVDDPLGVGGTVLAGISANGTLTGYYMDIDGNSFAFMTNAAVPEPATVALFGLGGGILACGWVKSRRQKS